MTKFIINNRTDVWKTYWRQNFTVVCLVTWPLNGSEAGVDCALIQTSLLLSCKLCEHLLICRGDTKAIKGFFCGWIWIFIWILPRQKYFTSHLNQPKLLFQFLLHQWLLCPLLSFSIHKARKQMQFFKSCSMVCSLKTYHLHRNTMYAECCKINLRY